VKDKSIPASRLYKRCAFPESLTFSTTRDLPDLIGTVGQHRAEESLELGITVRQPGYNVYVLGEPGSGRHSTVTRLLETYRKPGAVPDWCYVNNFKTPTKPRVLQMPAGRGKKLQTDMAEFARELGPAISGAFDADSYRTRIEMIQEEFKKREEGELQVLGDESVEHGVALLRTPEGFAFAPVVEKKVISPKEFGKLPEEEQKRIEKTIEEYSEKLHQLTRQFPRWRREMQGRIKQASRETLGLAVEHLLDDVRAANSDLPEVLTFLDELLADVIETGEALRDGKKIEDEEPAVGMIAAQRYSVNLLVEQQSETLSPIVYEDNPNYQSLMGRCDQMAHFGTLVTNFTLIKSGALHRANGGTLILDAEKLVSQPFAYDALKRALKSNQIRIETPGALAGLITTLPLEPEPVPLSVKVVLLGSRTLYYLLREFDPEFQDLFKIAADFESDLERTEEHTVQYAVLIGHLARKHGLKAFTRDAVARIIEHASRITGDGERMTMRTRLITNLMTEADHHAAAGSTVDLSHVEAALAAQIRRSYRVKEVLLREVLRGTLLISTDGEQVGQINGLAVMAMGDVDFAQAIRITAAVWQGKGELIDIERESDLGGKIHSKGVLILSAFLSSRFGRGMPLSLAGSLVFEQSYGMVEGDSASLAEICALLSAICGAPIRQSFAVTGSINQQGLVQAIGGVNEKIEGFFDLCLARGLNGQQGVIIPESNVKHLMLRADIVRACEEGKFRIYSVETVDDAIELLTGIPAGMPDPEGNLPPGSINYLVAAELAEMTALRERFNNGKKRKKKKKK
jgi:lon-related putative ATP-dependent protease